jgi:hypothetical protein
MSQPDTNSTNGGKPDALPESSASTATAISSIPSKPGKTPPQASQHQQRGQGAARSRPRSQAPSKKVDVTRPNDPGSASEQISTEYQNVEYRTDEHSWRAGNWDTLASWLRVIVTLTAGVSALSVFADSQIMAAIFAAITALVSAVNAGFNPPEKAKAHRDAARAYGHLERPLAELLYVLDEGRITEYVPQTGHDLNTGMTYDAGYYRTMQVKIPSERLSEVWTNFLKLRERIESIDESAPTLRLQRHTPSGYQAVEGRDPTSAAS